MPNTHIGNRLIFRYPEDGNRHGPTANGTGWTALQPHATSQSLRRADVLGRLEDKAERMAKGSGTTKYDSKLALLKAFHGRQFEEDE